MKTALDIDEQIARLKEHGMCFDDEVKAKEILLDVGYYRLGFYSFPFEKSFPDVINRDHKLREGTNFTSIVELYYFDYDLRRILSNYLNRIEVNIRTQITYIVSNRYKSSPTWFVNPSVMKKEYISHFPKAVYNTISDNPAIKRHHTKYINDKYAPAWKTLEFMTLGNLIMLYHNLKDKELQKEIALHYKCSFGVFCNYMETIRIVRNKCAHGNCLYNMNLSKGIKKRPANIEEKDKHNIKGGIEVIRYFLNQISSNRLKDMDNSLHALMRTARSKQAQDIISACTGLCEYCSCKDKQQTINKYC